MRLPSVIRKQRAAVQGWIHQYDHWINHQSNVGEELHLQAAEQGRDALTHLLVHCVCEHLSSHPTFRPAPSTRSVGHFRKSPAREASPSNDSCCVLICAGDLWPSLSARSQGCDCPYDGSREF